MACQVKQKGIKRKCGARKIINIAINKSQTVSLGVALVAIIVAFQICVRLLCKSELTRRKICKQSREWIKTSIGRRRCYFLICFWITSPYTAERCWCHFSESFPIILVLMRVLNDRLSNRPWQLENNLRIKYLLKISRVKLHARLHWVNQCRRVELESWTGRLLACAKLCNQFAGVTLCNSIDVLSAPTSLDTRQVFGI